VLPIKLKAFNAVMNKGISNLSFTTESESNNAGFEIERSSDGASFDSIGWLDGYGTTSYEKHYKFVDDKPLEGLNFYRLRQVDFDGRFEYSEVKSIQYEYNEISIYPNPVQDIINISGSTIGQIFQILDINHKIIKKGFISEESAIDVGELSDGLYLIQIRDL
jgi:hypothetical protein